MPASRLARTIAGAAITALAIVGFIAAPASASPSFSADVRLADVSPSLSASPSALPTASPSPTVDPVTATVTGQVLLGAAGTSTAGAGEVRVTPATATGLNPPVPIPDKAVLTDAAGHFSISGLAVGSYDTLTYEWLGTPGAYQASVKGRSFRLTTAADFTAPTVHLLHLASVSGHVYLADASHPAGAGQVQVILLSDPCSPTCVVPAMTAADGGYTITGVPEGARQLAFQFIPGVQYSTQDSSLTVGDADVAGVDATLPYSPTITGRVTNSAGAPLAGAAVYVDGQDPSDASRTDWEQTTTDGTGAYAMAGLVSGFAYTVRFTSDGYLQENWPNTSTLLPADTITLGVDEVRTHIDGTLYHPGSASGTVTAPGVTSESLGAAETSVDVLTQDPTTHRWVDDTPRNVMEPDGTWQFRDLPPGTFRFQTTYTGPLGLATVTSASATISEGGHITYSPQLRMFQRDFTSDYRPDILVRNTAGQLLVYPSNGSGGFLARHQVGNGWNGMTAILNVGGFDSPWEDDVIARDAKGNLWLYPTKSAGGFWGYRWQIGNGWNSMNVIFSPGDFDGDGHPDVMARDAHGGLWLYRGDGKGRWRGTVKVGNGWGSFTAVFAAGDMNEDGFPDVMARDARGGLWLYPGNGKGGWKPAVKVGTGWSAMTAVLSVGDFGGDRAPDVLARDSTGHLWMYPGNGDGTFGSRKLIGWGWNGLSFVG